MNKVDAAKVLSILEVAYPHAYKDMNDEKKYAMCSLWERKFAEIPAEFVFMAVDELIEVSKFPPSIADVAEKLDSIYWDNFMYKWAYDSGTLALSAEDAKRVSYIHNSLMPVAEKELCKAKNEQLKGKEQNLLGG